MHAAVRSLTGSGGRLNHQPPPPLSLSLSDQPDPEDELPDEPDHEDEPPDEPDDEESLDASDLGDESPGTSSREDRAPDLPDADPEDGLLDGPEPRSGDASLDTSDHRPEDELLDEPAAEDELLDEPDNELLEKFDDEAVLAVDPDAPEPLLRKRISTMTMTTPIIAIIPKSASPSNTLCCASFSLEPASALIAPSAPFHSVRLSTPTPIPTSAA